MRRDDWVFVGTRLGGLFLLCRGFLALPDVLEWHWKTHAQGALYALSAGGVAEVTLGWALGMSLYLGAPALQRWLARKDARYLVASGMAFEEEQQRAREGQERQEG